MTKAFAYLRVSGKGQVKGDGFPRQLAAIRDYAREHDIKIVRTFEERGIAGATEMANRPAFVEMMTALHGNGTRLVLIEKLDRLARDLMIQEAIVADFQKHKFQLISVAEPDLLKDDPSRKLMRQIFGAIAEYEKTMVVLKLRAARVRTKAREGRCEGAKPYGTFPGEAAVIKRMAALRDSKMAFEKIAAQLNEAGIKPRRGARWYGKTVDNILRSSVA